jgi:hypothetical protein
MNSKFSESEIVQQLSKIHFTKNYNRKNCMFDPHKGEYTLTFGKVRRPFHSGIHDSVWNARHPDVFQYLKDLIHHIDPSFQYTSIQVNKNFLCAPHVDKNNFGDSIIMSCGLFTGGELNINGIPFDIKAKPIRFNGSIFTHWTMPFDGNRFSIVWFSIVPSVGSEKKSLKGVRVGVGMGSMLL